MEHADTIEFTVKLPPLDVVTLCDIAQRPHAEQSVDDMMKVMTISANISHLAIETAKKASDSDIHAVVVLSHSPTSKIDPGDVADLQAILDARKRSTIDDIGDDLLKFLGRGQDYKNKEYPAATMTAIVSSASHNASPNRLIQCQQPDEPFIIVVHNTHTDRYWPAWIGSTTIIVELAQKVEGTEGIPLQRMRFMHRGNDLLVTARARPYPMQDDTIFGHYNIPPGGLVSLSIIARKDPMSQDTNHMTDHMAQETPSPFTSPAPAIHRLSTIQEELSIKERPYGRSIATHKLVTKSSVEGRLHDCEEIARRKTDVQWPQQAKKLQKARSLDVLRVASPAVSPVATPVDLGICGWGEQRDRRQAQEKGSSDAMSYRIPLIPSPPTREGRRDSVVPSSGSPLPTYMRQTASSRRVGTCAPLGQQQPYHRGSRQSVVGGGRTSGGPPARPPAMKKRRK
ncbi:hypothetical protein DOTSEDRAFT_28634 [Dothistroma septosporum NZE10]|uniref:Ubiquitin-like domain-containing protein n=1 Tax=Dothistroma septosporum (strain NZE10 / CBS 128990) TaxID=675120 RepID=M2XJ58_DOTSN|nr:hypothetical protein DOTSEDRAFT_28634 [Dothistroma septosporum NZE10]